MQFRGEAFYQKIQNYHEKNGTVKIIIFILFYFVIQLVRRDCGQNLQPLIHLVHMENTDMDALRCNLYLIF